MTRQYRPLEVEIVEGCPPGCKQSGRQNRFHERDDAVLGSPELGINAWSAFVSANLQVQASAVHTRLVLQKKVHHQSSLRVRSVEGLVTRVWKSTEYGVREGFHFVLAPSAQFSHPPTTDATGQAFSIRHRTKVTLSAAQP